MIIDGLLTFSGTLQGATGAPAVAGTALDAPTTGTQVASNIIDLGLVGLPPFASGGGARDIGIGDKPSLKLSAIVTTAFTVGTSLQIELDGAPDNGSGIPGAYTQMWLSEVFTEASLIIGCQLANVDVPRVLFEQVLPRFLRMQYITVGTHSTGQLEAQILIDRFDQIVGTTGALSGYPAGVNIAN
jgi:hypothetical protein